jgi:hypothetical protein
MRTKEENEKLQKIIKRKHIEDENLQKIEQLKLSRNNDHDTGYHLEIGLKS